MDQKYLTNSKEEDFKLLTESQFFDINKSNKRNRLQSNSDDKRFSSLQQKKKYLNNNYSK